MSTTEKNIILIITSSIDYTVDYIISKYPKVNFYRINIDMFSQYRFLITNNGWSIDSASGKVEEAQVQSIYYRKPMLPCLDEFDLSYQTMIGQDIIGTINGIVNSFDGLVITKPYHLTKTENKIFQLQALKSIGVTFPASVIGNICDMDHLINAENKIVKPLSQGKIDKGKHFEFFQTNLLSEDLGDIRLTPIYIQEEVPKAYEVRITCVDNYLWPVRIDTNERIDWRKHTAKNRYSLITVPFYVQEMCLQVMKKLEIRFGAFDFIVCQENMNWIFLEVNPNGQWLWLEQALGLDISEKLVNLLANGG